MKNQINLAGMEVEPTATARMSKELLETAKKQLDEISEEDYEKVMGLVKVCKREWRSILHKTPDDYGMTGWEDVYFQAVDGVPLSGWYIPAKGGESDKLVIFNHALPMCRAGFQGHLGKPWADFIDIEIDFVIQMKHLTDAGYNVLAYDLRNHGQSGTANNGMSGIGQLEWRDCVGVKKYVDAHPRLSKMKVALYNQCLGAISQWVALDRHPELFENVKCFASPLVPNMSDIYLAFAEPQGIGKYMELLDFLLVREGGFTCDEMDPRKYSKNITMPLLMWQVERDSWVKNPKESSQSTFDSIPGDNKELVWVDSENRFKDGYNWFGRTPEKALAFLDKYMKANESQTATN